MYYNNFYTIYLTNNIYVHKYNYLHRRIADIITWCDIVMLIRNYENKNVKNIRTSRGERGQGSEDIGGHGGRGVKKWEIFEDVFCEQPLSENKMKYRKIPNISSSEYKSLRI